MPARYGSSKIERACRDFGNRANGERRTCQLGLSICYRLHRSNNETTGITERSIIWMENVYCDWSATSPLSFARGHVDLSALVDQNRSCLEYLPIHKERSCCNAREITTSRQNDKGQKARSCDDTSTLSTCGYCLICADDKVGRSAGGCIIPCQSTNKLILARR